MKPVTSIFALLLVACSPSAHERTEAETRAALRDGFTSGPVSSGRVQVTYHEDVGSIFRRAEARFSLDGTEVYRRTFDARRPEPTLDVFTGSTMVGEHELRSSVRFASRSYGIFSYLPVFELELSSRYAFTTAAGSSTSLEVVAYEQGTVVTPIEQRLVLAVQPR